MKKKTISETPQDRAVNKKNSKTERGKNEMGADKYEGNQTKKDL